MTTFRSFCGSVRGLKKLLVLSSGQFVWVPEEHGLGLLVSDHESTTSVACGSPSARSSHPPISPWLLVASNEAPLLSHSHTNICGMKQLIYVKKTQHLFEREVEVENLFLKMYQPLTVFQVELRSSCFGTTGRCHTTEWEWEARR